MGLTITCCSLNKAHVDLATYVCVMASSGRKHRDEDLDSEFEYAPEKRRKTWRDDPIATGRPPNVLHAPSHSASVPSKQLLVQERDKEEWKARRYHLLAMDAYSRHKVLVNQYLLTCGQGIEHFSRSTEKDRNDYTVLREEHKFLWESSDSVDSWEKKLAKTYYDRLFKEYAIADLSRYKENKIALRWRIEKEVVAGKGQFACGNKHCLGREELQSWEVNFVYLEQGEKKNALVKLRLCPECSAKLNYHHKRKLWKTSSKDEHKKLSKKQKSSKKHHKKHGRREHESSSRKKNHRREKSPSDSEQSSSGDSDLKDTQSTSQSGKASTSEDGGGNHGDEIWSKPPEAFLEKSKEDEYDDYFKDMLL